MNSVITAEPITLCGLHECLGTCHGVEGGVLGRHIHGRAVRGGADERGGNILRTIKQSSNLKELKHRSDFTSYQQSTHLSDKVFFLVSELALLCRATADSRIPAGVVWRRRPRGSVVCVADGVHVDAARDRREDVGLARGSPAALSLFY